MAKEFSTDHTPATSNSQYEQPYQYPLKRVFLEPDWTRIPGYKSVTSDEWEDATWQRKNTIKNIRQLKDVLGTLIPETLIESIQKDMEQRATMSLLLPPQMINTMKVEDLWNDPVRLYMLPAFEDRRTDYPNHPKSSRDSLHEADMWVVEGLTHRYPTKVLAELLTTCPQYCGHCTRMDLVGKDTPQVKKLRFEIKQTDRHELIIEYLANNKSVRDVVVSGGDVANLPPESLEYFVNKLIEIPHIRDIRLASKALMALPQHFLQGKVLRSMERLAKAARKHDVDLALHTHVNHANQLTPLVAEAAELLLHMGFRDVRNQGVLLRGVNSTSRDLLDLCFTLLDQAHIMPYYFYMCDMIPNSEHWRLSVHEAQKLQHDIMGYLPGYATPRMLCDVPFVGKRWVHQVSEYDHEKGITYWTKNYRTSIEFENAGALETKYPYYDPLYTLPDSGKAWWAENEKSEAKESAGHPAVVS